MNPEKAKGPAADRTPRAATNANQAATVYPADRHELYMYGMDWRIRWLQRRRHWWLRTDAGRPQLEFIQRRAA